MARPTVRAALAVTGITFGLLVLSTPAMACTPPGGGACGSTVVAVDLGAGSLTLSAPASVTITGTLGSAASFQQTMSTVQVQDARGTLAGWSLTALTNGDLVTATQPVRTISLGASASGGPLTLATGVITPVGVSSLLNVSAGTGGSLNPSQPIPVASAAFGFGGGTYTFTPTVALVPPANSYAGTYSTTVTFTLTG